MSRPTTRIVICRPDGPTDWQYEVKPGEYKIGRDSNEAAIFIGDQDISPEHALITIGTAGIEVRDLDSETGTFIMDGDQTLRVGNTVSVPLNPHQRLWLGTHYFVDFEQEENRDKQLLSESMAIDSLEYKLCIAAEQGDLSAAREFLDCFSVTAQSRAPELANLTREQVYAEMEKHGVHMRKIHRRESSDNSTARIRIYRRDNSPYGSSMQLGSGEYSIGSDSNDSQIYIEDIPDNHAILMVDEETIKIKVESHDLKTILMDGDEALMVPKGSSSLILPGQKLWVGDYHINIERKGQGELVEGARLGQNQFTLKRKLGKGGMGEVWLAYDEDTFKEVAIKLINETDHEDSKYLRNLEREVRKAKQLGHDNIVKYHDFNKGGNEPPFIIMEFVDGVNLAEKRNVSAQGLLRWKDLREYMLQLCDALEYAHKKNVVHRDIKPENVMIDRDGRLKLTDFGIAASLNSNSTNLTHSSILGCGTPYYMSPQQMDQGKPKATDDIYALGATFYDLLTSKPPFYEGGHIKIIKQVQDTEATDMRDRLKALRLTNNIPAYVNDLIMACLDKDPNRRPQTAGEIRRRIESSENKNNSKAELGAGLQITDNLLKLLADRDHLSPQSVEEVQRQHNNTGAGVYHMLHHQGILDKRSQLEIVAEYLKTDIIDISSMEFPEELLGEIPRNVARSKQCLPVGVDGATLHICMVDPLNENVVRELAGELGRPLQLRVSDPSVTKRVIGAKYSEKKSYLELSVPAKRSQEIDEEVKIDDPVVEIRIRMALGGGCPAKLTSIDLQRVTELRLAHLRLNDDGLMDVAKLECLEKLFLGCTQITDAGLYSLRELRFLKTLYLQETQITATGIRMLAEIKQLSHLDLSKTKLSYDNLYCELPGLKRLSSVRLDGVNLTGKQVVKLRDSFYDSCGHRLEILHIDSQY